MKLFFKLALLAVAANATWHVFVPYQAFHKFRDAVEEATLAESERPEDEQKARVLSLAKEFDIPVTPESFTLHREQSRTITDGSYTQKMEVFPTVFYPWTFSWHIDTLHMPPLHMPSRDNPK